MGCCKSSPDIVVSHSHSPKSTRASSFVIQGEIIQIEKVLSEIPDHCREAIINLPSRQLLNFYQYHEMAMHHGLQCEWHLAISYEQRAIKGLQALLPTNKDHYIFFNFYSILSASFLALGELQAAIEGINIALVILFKHTPTDYKSISDHYCHLADAYKAMLNWKATAEYLTKAIETARLSNDIDQEYIRMLETELEMTKQRAVNGVLPNLTFHEVKQKFGESDQDFHRRVTAETIAFSAKNGTLSFDKAEFERLPNKRTELQVTDEILKDVLKHLENHITLKFTNGTDTTFISVQFIAAQFKHVEMKTSSLSPAIIEAALTIIIDRLNDKHKANDKLYTTLKQLPVLLSYAHDSEFYAKEIRVFQVKRKKD